MYKKNNIVEVKLDSWRGVYEEAIKLKKAKLWQFSSDKGLLAIRLPDQEEPVFIRFIFDEETAKQEIVIYPNRNALHTYERFLEYGETDWFNDLAETECWRVLYTAKAELSEAEYQLIRELDYRFRGNNGWIVFRKEVTGYQDALPFSEQEVQLFTVILEQLNELCDGFANEKDVPDFEKGWTVYRYFDVNQKNWQQEETYLAQLISPMQLFSIGLQDQEFIAQLLKQPKTKYAIELDCNYFLQGEKDEDGHLYFPQVLVMVNANTGDVEAEYSIDLTRDAKIEEQVVNQLIDYIMEHGRPRRIYVRSLNLSIGLRDTCQQLNIPLRQRPALEKIDPQWRQILEELEK